MMQLINAERERLMGLGRSAWQSPWMWTGGAAGLSTLAVILYLIKMMRNRRKEGRKEKETRVIIGSARKDEETGTLQFGDIRME